MCNNSFFTNPYVSGILGSLIAGFLTIGIMEVYNYWKISIHKKHFKTIFGTYDKNKLNLVIPALFVRPDILQLLENSDLQGKQYPLIKSDGTIIQSSKLLAYADTVALKYILDAISTTLGSKSVIMTDEELQKKLDISFVSFGGSSFYCTYVLEQADNRFYKFNGTSIISTLDPNKSFTIDNTHDYGFIIKYKHANFPNQTWIIIAGIGESGTRGASYFLSKNWKRLSRDFKNNSFGLLVKVNHGIDHSAIEVERIT